MLVKTIPATSTEKFQLNYVPEKLLIVNDTELGTLAALISVKVTPLGTGVICDLDAQGVLAIAQYNAVRFLNAADDLQELEIYLADGLVPDKVTDYEIKNDSNDIIKVYAPITKKATLYVKSMQQTLLANSQVLFSKFMLLAFATHSEDDQVTVLYEDGSSHTYSTTEILHNNTKRQNARARAMLYNDKGTIRTVTVIPSTQKTAYLVRYVELNS